MAMYQIEAQRSHHVLDIDGIDIHYLDVGTGPPLLLVHGLGHSSVSWHRNIDTLRRSHRVLALDLPGYGHSGSPAQAPYDPPWFASIVRRFVQALGLHTLDAVGTSAGGLCVLLSALDAPKMFGRIVIVNPVGFTRAPSDFVGNALLGVIGLWQTFPASRSLIRAGYASAFYDPSAADEATVTELHSRRRRPASLRAARAAIGAFYNYSRDLAALHARLESLSAPVLVIWGKNDRMLPFKDTRVAQRVLRRARIEWLDHCGHCPQLERPDDFNALVLEFLNAL